MAAPGKLPWFALAVSVVFVRFSGRPDCKSPRTDLNYYSRKCYFETVAVPVSALKSAEPAAACVVIRQRHRIQT
jgi:hypothetical protein